MVNDKSIQSRFILLQTVLALAVAILGICVMLGWLFQVRGMVEIKAGSVAMVFNTALFFTLIGTALALPGIIGKPAPKVQTAIGATVFTLCMLIFIEHLFDKNIGIDWAVLHVWLTDGNTRPGRLAPNTAIGFMLASVTLILVNRVSNKWRAMAVPILTFAVLAIGLTGLVGYSLAPDLLFGWARSARMAMHTALCMIVVSIALWTSWYRTDWYRSRLYYQEDEKIGLIGAGILAVVTITAGMVGFVFQQQIIESTLRENLRAKLKSQKILFQTVIEQGVTNTNNIITAFDIQTPSSTLDQADMIERFTRTANRFLEHGFRGLVLYDVNGKSILNAGVIAHSPEIAAELQSSMTARILWDGDLYLQTETTVIENGVSLGRLLTEQSLIALRKQLFDTDGLGATGEIAVCKGVESSKLFCFPEGANPRAFKVNRFSASGRPLPMSFAIDGQSGIIAAVDYREKNVMAAYGPLATGVGLVVKQETAELYQVIRDQLKAVVPVLSLLVVAGVLFLRSQLNPLVARLIASERKAIEKELEIKTVVGSVGEGILIIDERGIVESFNAAASKIFGYAAEEILGKGIKALMPPEQQANHERGMSRYLQGGEARVIGRQGVELPGVKKDGSIFPLELTVNEIRLEHRRLFVGIVRDITERKQIEEKLVLLAQYDVLTGLPNRSLFMDRLSSASLRAKRNGTGLAVMFLDLDGFKQINDSLGHHCGDDLLKQFALRLTAAVRKTDTVSRLAGDEFTILLEELTATEVDAKAIADKIISAMQPAFLLGDKEVVVTASIGLAIHRSGEFNLEALLRRADQAMYKAKNSGRNRWCLDGVDGTA